MFLVIRPNVAWVHICNSFSFEDSIHFFNIQLLLAISIYIVVKYTSKAVVTIEMLTRFTIQSIRLPNTSNLMTLCRKWDSIVCEEHTHSLRKLIKKYCKIKIYSSKMCPCLFRSTNYFLLIAYKFDVPTRCVDTEQREAHWDSTWNIGTPKCQSRV